MILYVPSLGRLIVKNVKINHLSLIRKTKTFFRPSHKVYLVEIELKQRPKLVVLSLWKMIERSFRLSIEICRRGVRVFSGRFNQQNAFVMTRKLEVYKPNLLWGCGCDWRVNEYFVVIGFQ